MLKKSVVIAKLTSFIFLLTWPVWSLALDCSHPNHALALIASQNATPCISAGDGIRVYSADGKTFTDLRTATQGYVPVPVFIGTGHAFELYLLDTDVFQWVTADGKDFTGAISFTNKNPFAKKVPCMAKGAQCQIIRGIAGKRGKRKAFAYHCPDGSCSDARIVIHGTN